VTEPFETYEVVAHFPDDPTRAYQLLQWLPVLELLEHRTCVVTRQEDSAALLRELTSLPVLLAPSFSELTALYDALAAKVVLYCNNSPLNFQSLLDARMLHVHIGHGESDKQSMASNNAKAYDRVFVAGEAAVQRHVTGLLDYDDSRLVRIGRPQLDLSRAPLLEPSPRRTVLYAPTWEGDAAYNDYTSIVRYGVPIVRAALAVPDVRVAYKPHPKVVTSTRPAVREANEAVLAELTAGTERTPDAGHRAVLEGDILALMGQCDLMVTDVSSVGLDWLYLRTDKPLLVADPHQDAERLRRDAAVSRCADVVDDTTLASLTSLIAARLDHDTHHLARVAMRRHYFDDTAYGESTARFRDEVAAVVDLRDRLVEGGGRATG
jgi:hypothetical protein